MRRVFRHYAKGISALLRRGFGFNVGGKRVAFSGYDSYFELEDALQEVFRRAFSENARLRYDGLRPYSKYLGAITRNTVINRYQAQQRRLERFVVADADTADMQEWSAANDPLAVSGELPQSGNPERDLEIQEVRRLLQDFVKTLKGRALQVFELRYREGLSHAEITQRCGLSASKTKTTEAKLRKELLRFMKKAGYLAAHGERIKSPLAMTSEQHL